MRHSARWSGWAIREMRAKKLSIWVDQSIAWINIFGASRKYALINAFSFDHLANNLFECDCVDSGTWCTLVCREKFQIPFKYFPLLLLCVFMCWNADAYKQIHCRGISRLHGIRLWAKCLLFKAFKYYKH